MKFWYQHSAYAKLKACLLSPLAWLFAMITWLRRTLYQHQILKSYRPSVPVIIVGNLSVGGNGKTPVTLWLTQFLQKQGFKVGIISRGYGSHSAYYPRLVKINDVASEVGDEPLLLAKRSTVPVCIGANRRQAIELLQCQHDIDFIISDDGLQHYKLQRDFEIVVIEAERGLGNGKLLPAGPLRETAKRLVSVDLVISNGGITAYSDNVMQLVPEIAINLVTGEKCSLQKFAEKSCNAVAGIGNPQRFFKMLTKLGIPLQQSVAFADHQMFTPDNFHSFPSTSPLLMTEKDAVKCQLFAQSNWWFVPVNAQISGKIFPILEAWIDQIQQKKRNQK